jgi:hypothetical protein
MKLRLTGAKRTPVVDRDVLCDEVDRAHEGLRRIEGLALLIETASDTLEEIPPNGLAAPARIMGEECEKVRATVNRLWDTLMHHPGPSSGKTRAKRKGKP